MYNTYTGEILVEGALVSDRNGLIVGRGRTVRGH